MLRAVFIFLVLAVGAMLMGMNGFAGVTEELGQTLLGVFLILAVMSLIANQVIETKSTSLP
jgi:uncharacterized membrane protein YtjA (UPF0391 family)